jgi:hypothetical protein
MSNEEIVASDEVDNDTEIINDFHPPRAIVRSNPDEEPLEVIYYLPNQTNHITTTGRIVVMGGSPTSNAAIKKAIVAALLATADRMVGTMEEVYPHTSFNFWQRSWYPAEWRWTELHAKLSWEGTLDKFKRQQQRQKSLYKHYQQKRIKKGRSHSKQKHKGMNRAGR